MRREHHELIAEFLRGSISRRTFIRRAIATGLSASVIVSLLAAKPSAVRAQATPAAQPSGARPDGTPLPDDQQVLRIGISSPFRMDPPANTAGLWSLQTIVFQPLARVDAGNQIVPGVADSWESDPELTSWTFKLNPNAKFSDGTPITADDVKWTWDWYSNPASKSVGPERIANTIVGFDAVRDGGAAELEGIVVVDPQTITFNLTGTDPVFLAKAASYNTSVLKRENVESGGEEWWRTPVTSGLFKVTEYSPGDAGTMTLERNEHWWREPAKLSRIDYLLVADTQTQLVMYDNDELDQIGCPPPEFMQAIQPDGPRHDDLFWQPVDATWFFAFFVEKPPFDEVKVRQAFAHAVDRDVLSQAILGGLYQPQGRILSPRFTCGSDDQFHPAFDVELAKAALAESSYGGPDGLPKTTILVSEPGGATAPGIWGRMAQAIQQQLNENLGVEVEVVRKVYGTVEEQQQEARSLEGGVIFRLSMGVALIDPSYFTGLVQSGSTSSATQYANPEVDALIEQAAVETDEATRCELYTEIDRIVSSEAIFLAPFRGSTASFFKPRVRGIQPVLGGFDAAVHHMYIAE
ncbi:MAG: ABC transporter substrate-binding protein [Thermomicrobiales bacterium]